MVIEWVGEQQIKDTAWYGHKKAPPALNADRGVA